MKNSPFQSVTRVAIEEMIREYSEESRFGSFLSEENFNRLVDDLTSLMETSRSLKAAGDRFLSGAPKQKADIRRSVRSP